MNIYYKFALVFFFAGKEGPKRPESGPAAQIDIDSLLLESVSKN